MHNPRKLCTSPLTSNHTSRCVRPSTTGPTAISRTMSIFPFSIEICSSSPVSGRPKKYRVGTTLAVRLEWLTIFRRHQPQITVTFNKALVFLKDL
jgi:hypothetical protein